MPKYPFDSEELERRIAESIQKIKDKFCSKCFLGYLKPYKSSNGTNWWKCPICGFCRK